MKRALLRVFVLLAAALALPQDAAAEYGDIVLNNRAEKNGVRPVIFPHWFHRIRFRCKVCHNGKENGYGFIMRYGENNITMADIMEGKYCGMCHNDRVAWNIENCDICHAGLKGLKTGVYGLQPTKGPMESERAR